MNFSKIDLAHGLETKTLAELANLDAECMDFHWSQREWENFFASSGSDVLLLGFRGESGSLEGLLLFQLNPWSLQAHLLKICVKESHLGGGAAKSLFEKGREELAYNGYREIFLEVSANNLRARRFYEKLGFTLLCVKRAFYSSGEDAQALLLSL